MSVTMRILTVFSWWRSFSFSEYYPKITSLLSWHSKYVYD